MDGHEICRESRERNNEKTAPDIFIHSSDTIPPPPPSRTLVKMAELMGMDAGGQREGYRSEENSNVTIEMLDFDYVRECKKADELRAIVNVLKSGKEGFYPELLKEAEAKLFSVLPEKERKKYSALFSI